jgi:predicted nuclease of predicted toxin-antitoxin system
MKFKIDENLPLEAAELLRNAGFDAVTIYEQQMSGATDPIVAVVCRAEARAIITLDTDFADIRAYSPQDYPGIIVLRLKYHDKPHVLAILRRVIQALLSERLVNRLWIVDEDRIRIRE